MVFWVGVLHIRQYNIERVTIGFTNSGIASAPVLSHDRGSGGRIAPVTSLVRSLCLRRGNDVAWTAALIAAVAAGCPGWCGCRPRHARLVACSTRWRDAEPPARFKTGVFRATGLTGEPLIQSPSGRPRGLNGLTGHLSFLSRAQRRAAASGARRPAEAVEALRALARPCQAASAACLSARQTACSSC